jgi:hypothetical protein
MADMAGKSKAPGSVVVVYTAQALKKGDAPVLVEQHSLFLIRPTYHVRI